MIGCFMAFAVVARRARGAWVVPVGVQLWCAAPYELRIYGVIGNDNGRPTG